MHHEQLLQQSAPSGRGMVKGDQFEVVRERETVEELVKREQAASFL